MENLFLSQFVKRPNGDYLGGVEYKEFKDGSRYEGELLNGKWNGKGIYYYINGDKYLGDWLDDKFHGKGVYIFEKGDRYEGEL